MLILHGEADLVVPVANAEALASRLPRAQVRRAPGLGHALMVEGAEWVNEAMLAFLGEG